MRWTDTAAAWALAGVLLAAPVANGSPLDLGAIALADTTPPMIDSARVVYDPGDPTDTAFLEFVYSEPVDWFHAISPANYLDVNGGGTADQGAWFPPNRVRMRFPTGFDFGSCEQVRVTNVEDLEGNVIVDDGVGNVFTFHLQHWLVRGRMSEHMKTHDAPPHAFAVEGSAVPLTWSPLCDLPLADADGDSIWTRALFFDVPCTTATGGAETRDVDFHFSHLCAETEPSARLATLDLAAHPDGRDTLDLWWGDQAPQAPTSADLDVIFRVRAAPYLPPFGPGDTLGVVGSEFPLTWNEPPLCLLADDGVPPDDVAGDGIATARRTFPAGTHPSLLFLFAHKAPADTAFTTECTSGPFRVAVLDDGTYSTTNPLVIDVVFDDCFDLTATAEMPVATGGGAVLNRVWPNPAHGSARVSWSLPAGGRATVRVVDVHGRLVRRLVDGDVAPGDHHLLWDGRTDGGRPAASGVYFVRLAAGETSQTRRLVLRR